MITANMITVVNADSMDEPTFMKHMYARHERAMAGLKIDEFGSDYIEELYRTYHDTIHRLLILQKDLRHDHGH